MYSVYDFKLLYSTLTLEEICSFWELSDTNMLHVRQYVFDAGSSGSREAL